MLPSPPSLFSGHLLFPTHSLNSPLFPLLSSPPFPGSLQVVDSSDVIAQVLDVRDPLGTRCAQVEEYVKKRCPHKHIILILNKCDLVPTWATVRVPSPCDSSGCSLKRTMSHDSGNRFAPAGECALACLVMCCCLKMLRACCLAVRSRRCLRLSPCPSPSTSALRSHRHSHGVVLACAPSPLRGGPLPPSFTPVSSLPSTPRFPPSLLDCPKFGARHPSLGGPRGSVVCMGVIPIQQLPMLSSLAVRWLVSDDSSGVTHRGYRSSLAPRRTLPHT